MLPSIFSREARRCVWHAFQGVTSVAFRLGGKAPLLRGAAFPDVLNSIWKAKLCFPGTPFPVGLQSFSHLPLRPCLCLRQGNARVPRCGGVSLLAVAGGGACYPSRHGGVLYRAGRWPSSVLVPLECPPCCESCVRTDVVAKITSPQVVMCWQRAEGHPLVSIGLVTAVKPAALPLPITCVPSVCR